MMTIPVLIQHSRKVFSTYQKMQTWFKSSKEEFIEALPKSFCREDYLNIAEKTGINHKTAERYIATLVKDNILNKKSHNNYINTLIQDDLESKEIEDNKDISPTPSISSKSLDTH
jgi:predicted transcriptional regulator